MTEIAEGGESLVEPAAAEIDGDITPDAYDACPLNIEDEIEACRAAGLTVLVTDVTEGDIEGVDGTTTGGESSVMIGLGTAAFSVTDDEEEERIGARNKGILLGSILLNSCTINIRGVLSAKHVLRSTTELKNLN